MPPKKKPKQSLSSDFESAEAAIAGKGWERSVRWKVVKARPRASDDGVPYYTLSYYCYKSRQDRMAKKSPTRELITTSMVPGCPARWRTHNEANLAMAKYVAVVEEAGRAGRKRSAGGDEGDVEVGGGGDDDVPDAPALVAPAPDGDGGGVEDGDDDDPDVPALAAPAPEGDDGGDDDDEEEELAEDDFTGCGGDLVDWTPKVTLRRPRGAGAAAEARRRKRSSLGHRAMDALAALKRGAMRLIGAVGGASRRRRHQSGHRGDDGREDNRRRDEENRRARVEEVMERNARRYQPMIDRLRGHLTAETTYCLSLAYDPEDPDSRLKMSDSELRRTRTKAECVERFLRYLRDLNTGEPGSLTANECAQKAADEAYGKVGARTVMGYFRNQYLPSEGYFLADERGSYLRDSWTSCFLSQDDLVLRLNLLVRANLRTMSLEKLAELMSEVMMMKITDNFDGGAPTGSKTIRSTRATTVEPDWYVDGDVDGDVRGFFWKRYGLSWPIKKGHGVYTIAHSDKIQLEYRDRKKSYMTDVHERAADDRNKRFLPLEKEMEVLQHKWIQLSLEEAEKLFVAHEKTNPNARQDLEPHRVKVEIDGASVDAVEFNVNASSAFEAYVESMPMGGSLSARRPSDAPPLVAIGQDEMCRHSHEYTSKCWTHKGAAPIDKKSRGLAVHVSGFVSRAQKIGFGFPLDEATLAAINAHRAGKQYPVTTSGVDVGQAWIKVQEQQGVAQPTKDMPPLKKNVPAGYWDNAVDICAVGLWHMNPGANKEGWWLGVHIIVHTYDVIQAFEFVYGKLSGAATPCQALFYFDHSAQHGHSKPDALSTTQMNLSWGGDQPIVRDTVIERSEGFLGPFEPMLKPGDTQHGYFDDPSAPPVDDPAAPPGNGRRATAKPKPPKHGAEYYRASALFDANATAEAKIRAATTEAGVAWVQIPADDAKAYVQARSIKEQGKRAATAPKDKKVGSLRARAATYHSENASITIDLGSKPPGYDEWRAALEVHAASVTGFLGQPKGGKQLLRERGLWHKGMSWTGKKDTYGVPETVDIDGVARSTCAKDVLAACWDYQNETSELEQMVTDLGHRAMFTPKGHCELAGEGIEYDWGVASRWKRKNGRDEDQHLQEDTLRSLSPKVLPVLRVRMFERTAWRYKQAYRRVTRGEATAGEFAEVERLQKEIRRHRDAEVELAALEGRRENPLAALDAPPGTAPVRAATAAGP